MTSRGTDYDERFASLAREGRYLHGEADLVDELIGGPPATVLDAGCGTGRVAIELARRGYRTVGVDVDPEMLGAASAKAPEQCWQLADLAELDAAGLGADLVVAAGNVMLFLRPGTLPVVVANLVSALRPGGLLVAGFSLGPRLPVGIAIAHGPDARTLDLATYDAACAACGLSLASRWATWEKAGYDGGDYAVSVHRRPPATPSPHRAHGATA